MGCVGRIEPGTAVSPVDVRATAPRRQHVFLRVLSNGSLINVLSNSSIYSPSLRMCWRSSVNILSTLTNNLSTHPRHWYSLPSGVIFLGRKSCWNHPQAVLTISQTSPGVCGGFFFSLSYSKGKEDKGLRTCWRISLNILSNLTHNLSSHLRR